MSPSGSFIQAVLKTDVPRVNEQINIQVNSTSPLDSYVFTVISRGNLILSRRVQADGQL